MHNPDPSKQNWVPVVSSTGIPLMPCHPARARILIRKGRAVKGFYKRFFYIQMLDVTSGATQPIALGVDPGSKMEGYTLKSTKRTLLNIQSRAIDGNAIKRSMETRHNARRSRRQHKTPYRCCRRNRAKSEGWVPPSTQARWQLKYNLFLTLSKLYPISAIIMEDVKAITKKGAKRWNSNFSPVQAGKNWLIRKLETHKVEIHLVNGYDTYKMRTILGLPKSKNKLDTVFSAHCVDSWVLANSWVGGHTEPDNTNLTVLKPLAYTRRQLHLFNPIKGGVRRRYGGTMSLGLKRGTLVHHPKRGKCLVGGYSEEGTISLHSPTTNERLTQKAKLQDITPISHAPWMLTGNHIQHLSTKTERRANRRNAAQARYHQMQLHQQYVQQTQGGNYAI